MNLHYGIEYASWMYREEALREARKRQLAKRASEDREPSSTSGGIGLLLGGLWSALKW
jgi:hypothetical protein